MLSNSCQDDFQVWATSQKPGNHGPNGELRPIKGPERILRVSKLSTRAHYQTVFTLSVCCFFCVAMFSLSSSNMCLSFEVGVTRPYSLGFGPAVIYFFCGAVQPRMRRFGCTGLVLFLGLGCQLFDLASPPTPTPSYTADHVTRTRLTELERLGPPVVPF